MPDIIEEIGAAGLGIQAVVATLLDGSPLDEAESRRLLEAVEAGLLFEVAPQSLFELRDTGYIDIISEEDYEAGQHAASELSRVNRQIEEKRETIARVSKSITTYEEAQKGLRGWWHNLFVGADEQRRQRSRVDSQRSLVNDETHRLDELVRTQDRWQATSRYEGYTHSSCGYVALTKEGHCYLQEKRTEAAMAAKLADYDAIVARFTTRDAPHLLGLYSKEDADSRQVFAEHDTPESNKALQEFYYNNESGSALDDKIIEILSGRNSTEARALYKLLTAESEE